MNVPDHAQRSHAILSASGSARWLACTPSALLESEIPDDRSSVFANEGTLAHEFAELYLRAKINGSKPDKKALKALQQNELYTLDMEDYAKGYANYAYSKIKTDDANADIEVRLDFSKEVPGGYGTGDCVICQAGTVTIVDYKYGKGVPVDAHQNSQMKLYALGAIHEYDFAYEINDVQMCIYQPRLENVSEWETSRADLEAWAQDTLIPRARLANEGKGEFKVGKHCQFCRARSTCKALANYSMEIIRDDFRDETSELELSKLTPEDYAEILSRIDTIEKWIRAVKASAMSQLLDDPDAIPGYKLVEGRSNRQYSSVEDVADVLEQAGYVADQIYKPRELLGITEMTKLLGRKQFNALLEGLIKKPAGKPTLVPVNDPRPVFTPESVENDFISYQED